MPYLNPEIIICLLFDVSKELAASMEPSLPALVLLVSDVFATRRTCATNSWGTLASQHCFLQALCGLFANVFCALLRTSFSFEEEGLLVAVFHMCTLLPCSVCNQLHAA
jgi:hypothetical protein